MATLPNGSTAELIQSEGWNVTVPTHSLVFGEGWNERLLVLSELTLSASPTRGDLPLDVTVSGTAKRQDGNAIETVEVVTESPTGVSETTQSPVDGDTYETTRTLDSAGEWQLYATSEFAGHIHSDGWNVDTPAFTHQFSEGWESA